jgi:pimeloyl-ACP methyl ester carboxylesterase
MSAGFVRAICDSAIPLVTPSTSMSKRVPIRLDDLRGVGKLAIDAALGMTDLVENLHHNIAQVRAPLASASQAPTRGVSGLVYRSIRGVTRLVGGGIDLALNQLTALLGPSSASSPEREAVLAALNGLLGDHLAATNNPLAIRMQFRCAGKPLPNEAEGLRVTIPRASRKIIVLLHGLCMNDQQWRRKDHDHGAALAADVDCTSIYLRYNSGLHVSSNGRELALMLESLMQNWPVPVEELVLLGHSMGGLVARSAFHYAAAAGLGWSRHLRAMIFLGAPHHGAPLERGGNWIDILLGASPYTSAFARLGKIRSAGITDLRHGSVRDEDWAGRDRFARGPRPCTYLALPRGARCYAIAASRSGQAPVRGGRISGDGLVPVASALGQHEDAQRRLRFPKNRTWIGYGMNHMDLLDRSEVYATLLKWLKPA